MINLSKNYIATMLDSSEFCMTAVGAVLETLFSTEELYGEDSLDIRVLEAELRAKFGVQVIHPAVLNRINALITLRSSNLYESSVEGFVAVTLACVDGQLGDLVSGSLETPDMEEALWSIFECSILDPDMEQIYPAVAEFIYGLPEAETEGLFDQKLAQWTEQMTSLGVPQPISDQLLQRGLGAINEVNAQ